MRASLVLVALMILGSCMTTAAPGARAWHRVLGGEGYELAEDAAWTPEGDVVVAGAFEREPELGGSQRVGFLARLS